MTELLNLLSAGGDVGIWVLIAVTWKFDRRLIIVETHLQQFVKDQKQC